MNKEIERLRNIIIARDEELENMSKEVGIIIRRLLKKIERLKFKKTITKYAKTKSKIKQNTQKQKHKNQAL